LGLGTSGVAELDLAECLPSLRRKDFGRPDRAFQASKPKNPSTIHIKNLVNVRVSGD
jgi:hypothetical protein